MVRVTQEIRKMPLSQMVYLPVLRLFLQFPKPQGNRKAFLFCSEWDRLQRLWPGRERSTLARAKTVKGNVDIVMWSWRFTGKFPKWKFRPNQGDNTLQMTKSFALQLLHLSVVLFAYLTIEISYSLKIITICTVLRTIKHLIQFLKDN